MSTNQVLAKLNRTRINTIIELTMAQGPTWNEKKEMGRIISIQGKTRTLKTHNKVISLPFEDDNNVITDIKILQESTLNVNIQSQNGDIDENATCIFIDGAARPNPGPAASGIIVRKRLDPFDPFGASTRNTDDHDEDHDEDGLTSSSSSSKFQHTIHSTFYANNTSNQAERMAFVAACRHIIRERNANSKTNDKYTIIMSSEFVYKTITGTYQNRNSKLAEIIKLSRESYMSIANTTTIATMSRQHSNPAEKVVKQTLLQGMGIGNDTLFPQQTWIPPTPRIQTPSLQFNNSMHAPNEFQPPTSVTEYANLRKFPCRSRIPAMAIHLWTNLFKYYLTKFNTETDPKNKEIAFLRVLTLPHFFLPSRSSSSRVIRHLQLANPFSRDITTNIEHETEEDVLLRKERTHNKEQHRISEAITRLVNDRKVHSANKLIYSIADGPELDFDTKKKVFESKLLKENTEPPTFPRQTVPLFSDSEIIEAVKKLNRQSSTAIDGYTKDILQQSFQHDPSTITLFGQLLHWMLTEEISQETKSILLLNRGVAIPKPEGGARPICVSSTLLKMIGTIAMKRDGSLPSKTQMAVGTKEGHVRIVHKIREHITSHENSSIIRVDISNAFGTMP